jgi:DNA polymerase-3 subunit alpha
VIHLHAHSSFSQLDGVGSCDHRAEVAVRLGHAALGISDHGHINGALAHRKACEKRGLIPVVGSEVYWRPDRLVREKEQRFKRWHLILIAKNLRGWHNLIRITSAAHGDGFYQSPCADWDLMERYGEGLICTTSCILGPLPYLIENGTDREVRDWIERAQKIHGDDLYFSIMPHDIDRQREVNLAIVSLAREYGGKLLHEKDSHYPEPGWVDTQKVAILTGINQTFAQAEEVNRKRIEAGDEVYELWHDGLHLSGEEEDREMYARHHPDLPAEAVDEAIRNTDELLLGVEPYLMDRSLKMPRAARGENQREVVLGWCCEGLREMGRENDQVYEERLRYEIEVVDAQRAWPLLYFVGDVVRWARSTDPLPKTVDDPDPASKSPIRLNSGRGSAAASLICRASRITMIDPITHKFKFERFMNPERRSIPDIDIDVASSCRGLLKEYVARKYGRDSVADVVSQQTWQPRAALLNVTKTIYGYDHQAFKEVARLTHEDTGVIDPVHDTNLVVLRERESELDSWATRWPDAWEHARRLENAGDPSVLRLSKHAGAVAVLPGDVTDFIPTIRASEEEVGQRTAWAETTRISIQEELGIVKADFLALKGMDQQQMIVDMIAEYAGEQIELDSLPPLNDPYDVEDDVMCRFREGTMLGVNQLQGDGISDFLRRAGPENIVDLTAVNALYRPGPLGSGAHNRFVKRKRGEERADYPEILRPILEDTYFTISFQEQVMSLFEVLVGYTPGQADDIRKIIAKLYRDKGDLAEQKLAEHKTRFIDGATEKLGDEWAQRLWEEILPFTAYSFNRPHAGSYMIQSYQDAWLKQHYPLFFYAVLLTMEEKKAQLILREARAFDVSVLPPDVNVSGDGFTVDHEVEAVRYGLRGIKGIGEAVAKQVVEDRPFEGLHDFTQRSSRKYSKVNKKAREILTKVGALDRFGARNDGQVAWISDAGELVLWDSGLRARCESELLGITLEPGGILGADDSELVRENIHSEQEVFEAREGEKVVVGGFTSDLRKTRVKRGKQTGREMAFAKLSLDLDEWSLTLFPDSWDSCRELVESGEPLMVRGRVDENAKIIVTGAMPMAEFLVEVKSPQAVAA